MPQVSDIEYKQIDGRSLVMDLHLPEQDGPHPVVVWIYGGGWKSGSKNGAGRIAGWLVEEGFALAAPNYRLSDEAVFPAQIEDCKAAVRWLRAHAGDYDLRADRIGAWGDSAGGHLTCLLATAGRTDAFDAGENLEHTSAVQAACALFPPTDLVSFPPNNQEVPKLLGGHHVHRPDLAAPASPITYADPDCPPMLLLHGDQDRIVPLVQSVALREKLARAGMSCTLHVAGGVDHQGDRIYGDDTCRRKIATFFQQHLAADSARPADTL